MNIAEKTRNFLVKAQNLPEDKKKIILWTIVVFVGLVMGTFWVRGAINNLSKIGKSVNSIKIPAVNTSDMPKFPNLDISQTTTPSNK